MKKHGSGAHFVFAAQAETVLALNRRESSIHWGLFSCREHREELLHRGRVRAGSDDGPVLRGVLKELEGKGAPSPTAVGHRLLYGGLGEKRAQAIIGPDGFAALTSSVSLAPRAFGVELALLQVARAVLPQVPHVACFDTAFHATIPAEAFTYALPEELRELGVRRLGFHGLSYESVVDSLGPDALGRALLFYLDTTASIAAIRGGESVDTTMGLTPLGGLVMGTHPGDLDPGIILYLLRAGYGLHDLERIFSERAGLTGISGESDIAALVPRRARDPNAALAFDMFVRSAQKWAGALTTVLGGLDSIVFLGDASENAVVRDEICHGLGHLGVVVDPSKNRAKISLAAPGTIVSTDRSAVTVRVLRSDEEQMVARHAKAAISRARSRSEAQLGARS